MSSLVYGHLVLRVADSHHPLGDKPKKLKTLKLCKGSFFFLCKQTKQKWNFTILKSKLQFNANLSNSTDTLLIAKLLLQITHNSMELSAQTTSWVCWDQWKELMYVSHCCQTSKIVYSLFIQAHFVKWISIFNQQKGCDVSLKWLRVHTSTHWWEDKDKDDNVQ